MDKHERRRVRRRPAISNMSDRELGFAETIKNLLAEIDRLNKEIERLEQELEHKEVQGKWVRLGRPLGLPPATLDQRTLASVADFTTAVAAASTSSADVSRMLGRFVASSNAQRAQLAQEVLQRHDAVQDEGVEAQDEDYRIQIVRSIAVAFGSGTSMSRGSRIVYDNPEHVVSVLEDCALDELQNRVEGIIRRLDERYAQAVEQAVEQAVGGC